MNNLDYAEKVLGELVQRISSDCRKMSGAELGEQIHRWQEKLTTLNGSAHAAVELKINIAAIISEEEK